MEAPQFEGEGKTENETGGNKSKLNGVLSAVQSAVNRQLCDAKDYYDGMQRSVDRHKNKSYDKNSLMLPYREALDCLNNAHADMELWMKAQAFVRDKLPGLIEGR